MTRTVFIVLILISPAAVLGQDYMAIYNEGVSLIEAGQPAEARLKFQEILKSPQDNGLHDNAEYWIAVSYFDEKRYDMAIEHYRRAQVIPDGNKAAAAQYELAVAAANSGDSSGAILEFYKLKTLYPNSGLGERADKKIKALGGTIAPKIPKHGPLTPTLAAASPQEPATEPVTEPEPETVPETKPSTEPGAPPATSEKPETRPEPKEPETTQPTRRRRTVEPVPLGSVPVEPTETAVEEIEPVETVTEPETEETRAGKPVELASAELGRTGEEPAIAEEKQPAEQKPSVVARTPTETPRTEAGYSSTENGGTPKPIEGDTAPLTVDPRSLIRPEDKRGF